jgi:serine/threonine protein kinase
MTNVLIDILDGLKLIHERGYLHCDIKPDNILIDENYRAKVADFGLCQKMEPGMSVQGTPSYIAPEMVADWFGYVDDCLWDAKADVFSFGVLVTVSLTGSFPFQRMC